MRLTIGFCIANSLVFTSFAAEQYVQPTKDKVGVYANEKRELYEKPVFQANTNDRLVVIKTTRRHYRVKNSEGKTGWVEKRLVVPTGKGKTFIMGETEVMGYLDNPTPVYIMDGNDPNADPIKLNRSFSDALRENVDKETVERQVK